MNARAAAAIIGVLLLGAAVAPELGRYAAERRLAAATAAIAAVAAGGRIVPEAAPMLASLAATARATAAANPSDARGLISAGTGALVAGEAAAARRDYRAALTRGERAEIDVNLARAFALDGRRDQAEAALLRAVWLSPALIATLPRAERPRLAAALADLEARLAAGTLAAPPPLPDEPPSPAAD